MNIRIDAFLLNETISEIIQSIVYTTSQKFEKGVFTPKTHQIISGFKTFLVHTYRIRCGFVIFHSGEPIQNNPDSPDTSRRKLDGSRIRKEKVADSQRMLACEQAHIWEHAQATKSDFKSEGVW